MIRLEFLEEEINALYNGQFMHENQRMRKKIQVLYLKSMGLEHGTICRVCRIVTGGVKLYEFGRNQNAGGKSRFYEVMQMAQRVMKRLLSGL